MKSMLKIAAGGVIAIVLSSFVVHERRGIPPAHVKKVYIYDDRGYHNRSRGHRHHR